MRLRQVALVAGALEPVVADLTAVFGLDVAFRDPGVAVFGLENAVMPIGDTFLEVVSPTRPDATARRFLERRGGDGGYMAIFQTDDLDAARRRVAELGIRVAWSAELPEAQTIHLHPRDIGGAIVSIDRMTDPSAWHWAGPAWRSHARTEVVTAISGVELQATDPKTLAARWSALLSSPASVESSGARAIRLDGSGTIRFVEAGDGRGDGIRAIDLDVANGERSLRSARARGLSTGTGFVSVAGVDFRFGNATAI